MKRSDFESEHAFMHARSLRIHDMARKCISAVSEREQLEYNRLNLSRYMWAVWSLASWILLGLFARRAYMSDLAYHSSLVSVLSGCLLVVLILFVKSRLYANRVFELNDIIRPLADSADAISKTFEVK
ncbi:MAG: hypothetical protein CMI52_05055 [Parcubacteria group bacterium]|nr:hypothetical protein [Parcubacteria group bacterium]